MPKMLLIEPVDLLGQRAQITMTRDQMATITQAVQGWVGEGNDVANLTLVRDRANGAWVLMGAEIKTDEDSLGELTKEQWKELVRKGQERYREAVRFDLTAGGQEWYTLRVTESVQVGGMG